MAPRLYLLAALAGATTTLAAASTTTVPLIMFYDPSVLVGSVISADAEKTTYLISCKPSVPIERCPNPELPMTVIQGPSTFVSGFHTVWTDFEDNISPETSKSINTPVYATATIDSEFACKLDPKRETGRCNHSVGVTISSKTSTTSTHITMEGPTDYMAPILITGGVEKLSQVPRATQTSEAVTTTESSDSANTTAAPSNNKTRTRMYSLTAVAITTDSVAPVSTTPASTTTSTHNAAGPMATRNAGLAGVAAVIGGGMLLL